MIRSTVAGEMATALPDSLPTGFAPSIQRSQRTKVRRGRRRREPGTTQEFAVDYTPSMTQQQPASPAPPIAVSSSTSEGHIPGMEHELLEQMRRRARNDAQFLESVSAPYRFLATDWHSSLATSANLYRSFAIGPAALLSVSQEHIGRVAAIIEQDNAVLQQLSQMVEEWPSQEQRLVAAFVTLAEAGWYWDLETPSRIPVYLADALGDGDTDAVLDGIAAYFRERVASIEAKIIARYPRRRGPLTDAFDAHREGRYNLSVPVFLAQADGIWWEEFSEPVFSERGRRLLGDGKSKDWDFGIDVMFSRLFRKSAPLWKSASVREPDFKELNRHQVLHGEVSDYGTECNSLKAISFLAFVCCVLDN